MSDIVMFEGQNLPAPATLISSLRKLEAEVGTSGGFVILKMDKTGTWVFGADQTEVQEGSHWAVNPFSFVHGFIAWGEAEVLGEKMCNIAQPLPETGEAPANAKKGWEAQLGMSLKCVNGDDKGMEVRYTTTSVGGKRAVQILAAQIAEQVEKDANAPVPLISLGSEHYQHKSYGKIYTPVFGVTSWVPMSGGAEVAVVPDAPKRRRRAPVAA